MSFKEPPGDQVPAGPLPFRSISAGTRITPSIESTWEAPEEREGMAVEGKEKLTGGSSLQAWWLHRGTRHGWAQSCTPGSLRDAALSPSCWIGFPSSSSCVSMFPVSDIVSPRWELSMKHQRAAGATTSELQSANLDSQISSQKKNPLFLIKCSARQLRKVWQHFAVIAVNIGC